MRQNRRSVASVVADGNSSSARRLTGLAASSGSARGGKNIGIPGLDGTDDPHVMNTQMQMQMQMQMQYQLMGMAPWPGMKMRGKDTVEIDTPEDVDRHLFLQEIFRQYAEARDQEKVRDVDQAEAMLSASTKLRHSDTMFEDFLKQKDLRCSNLRSTASLIEIMRENKRRKAEAEVLDDAHQEISDRRDTLHRSETIFAEDEEDDDLGCEASDDLLNRQSTARNLS